MTLKRSSNRLVLLVGIFLAVVAFVLIAILLQGGGSSAQGPEASAATVKVVVAAKDLKLGTKITLDSVTLKDVPVSAKDPTGYSDPSQVVGQTVRQDVLNGQQINAAILNSGGNVQNIQVPAGYVGVTVQVDQITGVGTLIKPGDRVDVITGFSTFPLVAFSSAAPSSAPGRPTPTPAGSTAPGVKVGNVDGALYNPNSVKTIVDGLLVLGTLLPPASQSQAAPSGQPQNGTNLNGQQEIVILAATSQQAEAIRFAQVDGTISLVLRSSADCQNTDGTPKDCPIVPTTGITLRKMVDDFGVLPPQVVEVLMPTPYPSPLPNRLFPSPSPTPSGSPAPSASAKP